MSGTPTRIAVTVATRTDSISQILNSGRAVTFSIRDAFRASGSGELKDAAWDEIAGTHRIAKAAIHDLIPTMFIFEEEPLRGKSRPPKFDSLHPRLGCQEFTTPPGCPLP